MEQNQFGIELTQVNSKTVSRMGYYEGTMYVMFSSGVTYKYSNISPSEYKSILEDDSIGSKLRRVVSEKLYLKLTHDDPEFKRLKY